MIQYFKYTSLSGFEFIKRINTDGSESHIPSNLDNSDYKQYLEWVSEGNVAEEVNN